MDNFQNYDNLLAVEPENLFVWIQQNYIKDVPVNLETPDELILAGQRLGELTNLYSYFVAMVTIANIKVKDFKREKKNKDEIDEMMERRDILQSTVDVLKMQYTAISRMITVKKQADDEIRMI